jgi:hypothetical protein
VRVEVTNIKGNSLSQMLLPVSDASASCRAAAAVPACQITKPTQNTEIEEQEAL